MRFAVFLDGEIFPAEVGDGLAFVIGDDHVEENDACFYFYRGGTGGSVGSGSLRMEWSNGHRSRERPNQVAESPTSHRVLILWNPVVASFS